MLQGKLSKWVVQKRAPVQDVRKEARAVAHSKDATAGPGWFDMKAQTITPEIKRDWQLLRLRSAYDPRHFYKVCFPHKQSCSSDRPCMPFGPRG
jgi:hypothetical protein